jgi:hypothetical protein
LTEEVQSLETKVLVEAGKLLEEGKVLPVVSEQVLEVESKEREP